MLPLNIYTVTLDEETWRFIISELKQNSAYYTCMAKDFYEKDQETEFEAYLITANRCDIEAMNLSSQIEGQKG